MTKNRDKINIQKKKTLAKILMKYVKQTNLLQNFLCHSLFFSRLKKSDMNNNYHLKTQSNTIILWKCFKNWRAKITKTLKKVI